MGDAGLNADFSLTAYYEQTGNSAGRWFGEGLAGLGDAARRLRPGDVVTEVAMTAVFRDGVDPLTEGELGRPYSRFDDGKRRAVVGFDLTYTAPKSASVLWALADDATRLVSMTRTGRRWRHRWSSSSSASSARESAQEWLAQFRLVPCREDVR